MLVIISGPSGVGKNTVIENLIKRNPQIKYLLSYTTRPPERESEKSLQTYHHISLDEMKKMIENDEMYEYEEIHGNIYGTSKEMINEVKSDKIFIKDFGVLGAKEFEEKLSDAKKISIFLDANDNVLRKRLEGRGEQNIEKRMQRYNFERSHSKNFDTIIQNDDLLSTVMQIEKLIFHENN